MNRRHDGPRRILEASAALSVAEDVARAAVDARGEWPEPTSVLAAVPMSARVDEGRVVVRASVPRPVVPWFWWAADIPIRRHVRAHAHRVASALASGEDPPLPARPRWAPSEPLSEQSIRTIATLAFVLALTGYGGGLFTQTIDYVASSFDATDAQLGFATAATRLGAIIALTGAALADRVGRRRITLVAVAVVSVATALSAFAPALGVFTALQVILRAGSNVAAVVAIIALTEEAPEGARALTIAVAGVVGSMGFAIGSLLLPVADTAPWAWRLLFGAGGLGLVFLPSLARHLGETGRYASMAARGAQRGRAREVLDPIYGGRFWTLAVTAFVLNAFFAPVSQFANRYLGDERGYSGFEILVLRASTQTVTAVVASVAGGRAAESSGRKPAAAYGLVIAAVATAIFYLTSGPALWVMLLVSTAAAAFAGPAVAAFNTELFPTEVRGTAGAGLLAAAVAGAMAGLLTTGALSEPLGSIGAALAITCVMPLVAGLVLVRRLPEARGRLLDEVSPPEV